MMSHPSLDSFHPVVAKWFEKTFGEPTPPQAKGWPLIAQGKNVLLLAPTGSGKTLAAFLKCLDGLYQENDTGKASAPGVQVLYISPLKALNNDIYRNLEIPLRGIEAMGREMGFSLPVLTTAVRTGDTPGVERQRMLRRPPRILITTPESLFLIISSKAREILKTTRFVIIDEIHTLFSTKRGAHLSLTLERLQHLVGNDQLIRKIGLSATMEPLEQVARYLAGYKYDPQNGIYQPRQVEIVDTGQRKTLDLKIIAPVPQFRDLPEKSIWPSIYQQLFGLIKEHRTTLIFVNNRRLAERITANMNQLAGDEIARTHHGSVSKEVRLEVEEMLKKGEISCIVATASLELGIDVGFIDLVVQIESPKEVSRGLQRVGRAGHIVGMPSKGRIIPKTRADLLESAAILREMKAGWVEPAKAVFNCLDVLAQQLVAMTAEGEWPVKEAFNLIRQAYNFQSLIAKDFENVLAMLSGSFETTEFVDLRPRIYWDCDLGIIKADAYGKRLVYSSGGTIPDRGYFGVYLEGKNLRLGELDEEFVYERRLNERFILGTSTWRIQEIRQDRVIVTPSRKGGEAIVPFWKADLAGRPFELGKRIGRFLGEFEKKLDSPEVKNWLASECNLDQSITENLLDYLGDQKRALGFIHTDRRLVIEEFPDEAGEWRILLHSPFGKKLHSALSLLIKNIWEADLQINVEAIPSDDGIMFHLPGGVEPPPLDWTKLSIDNIEQKVAELVSGTALFGITFRHAAQLSLVMPRTGYGRKRTPFWLSRLKAGNLLQTVAKYHDFPLVLETYRSILRDYFELDALKEVLQGLQQGQITVHCCRRQIPSPFASGHLFNFVGNFMYEGEAPKSELKLQLFGLGRETLKTIMGERGFRELFNPEILKSVSQKASGFFLVENNCTRESVKQWLEKNGDVFETELVDIFPNIHQQVLALFEELRSFGKAVYFQLSGKVLIIADRHLSVYLRAIASLVSQFPNLAVQVLPSKDEAIRNIVERYIRTHGPFRTNDIVKRYGFPKDKVDEILALLAAEGLVEVGEYLPGGDGEEWCEVSKLQEIHRRSLAQARREIEPRNPHEYGAFLARWQGIGGEKYGLEGLSAVLDQLQNSWLPAGIWESSVLPNRVRDYQPGLLDRLITSGQFSWRAKGGGQSLRVCFEKAIVYAVEMEEPDLTQLGAAAQNVYQLIKSAGALSWPQILQQLMLSSVVLWQALEELILNGFITNDTFGPIRYLLNSRPDDRQGVRGILPPMILAQMGCWSLLPVYRSLIFRMKQPDYSTVTGWSAGK